MGSDIKKEALSGMIWSGVQKYSTMIIQFISGIVLARLLTPYDYGCIGMLSIFMVLANSIIDGGFGAALIQKKNTTQEDYSTIFYWNLLVSVLIYGILFMTAPLIAEFYSIPLLSKVLRVQAVVLIINAFTLVQSNQLRKNLNFKLISIVTVITSFISLTVTIVMAYSGCGVWSLVAQNLITASIPAFVYWFYVKWRPIWVFSWESFKELFGFGFYMFLTNIINNFSNQIQGLLIGRVYSPAVMGYYSKAHSTEKLAASSISSIISQVTYPLYARYQSDLQMIIRLIKKFTLVIAFLTFPLMIILILTAEPIFILLYSERWLESVPYFQVFCVAGIVNCLMSINTQTISAIGKSRTMFVWTILKRTVGLIFMIGGLYLYGMKGLLWGFVLNCYFSYLGNIYLVSKHIGYKWYKQLWDLLPVALVAVISFMISYFVTKGLHCGLYIDAIVRALMFLMSYLAISIFFKLEAYKYTYDLIPQKFRFWENK